MQTVTLSYMLVSLMVQTIFHLLPASKADALSLMKNMVRRCRQEHGCLSYEYFEGVTDPNQVILLQEWENPDCLQEHYQTDHMDDFLGKLRSHLQSPIISSSYVSQEDRAVSSQGADELPSPEQTIH